MNNKIIAVIVMVILFVGAGYFFTKGKNANKETESNTQTSQTKTKGSTESGSLKSLLASASSKKCTYKSTQDNYSSEGTVYVSGGKMRGDISTNASGKASTTHMITKDSTSYIWTDDSKMAFKMSFDPSAAQQSSGAAASQNSAVDLEKNYDFSCDGWSGDTSMFELPAGINFSEIPKVPAMPESGIAPSSENNIDSKASAELVCNSLSGSAKEQCLKALQ